MEVREEGKEIILREILEVFEKGRSKAIRARTSIRVHAKECKMNLRACERTNKLGSLEGVKRVGGEERRKVERE